MFQIVKLIVLLPAVAFIACSKEKDDEKSDTRYMASYAIPSSYQLQDGVYPLDVCMPIQFHALEDGGSDPVALNSDIKIEFEKNKLGNGGRHDLVIYSDESCGTETSEGILPKSDLNPSIVKLYIKGSQAGEAYIGAKLSGTSWTTIRSIVVTFK